MKPRKPLSLTARLTFWYTLSSASVALLATLFLYWSLVMALEYRNEQSLSSKLDALRSILALNDNGKALRFRIEKEWPARTREVFFVRILSEKGELIAQSPEGEKIFSGWTNLSSSVQREKSTYRLIASKISQNGHIYSVQFAVDKTEEIELLNEYRKKMVLALIIALIMCALISYQIAHRGLRPLRHMARTAAKINSANLNQRIVDPKLPSELLHLAVTFDGMLDRLKVTFDRLQRFSADIAHELRTPINNITGELQVALGKERSASFYKDAIGSSLEECHRISRIIDSLLFLAKADDPKFQLSKEKIDLGSELKAVMEFYEASAAEAGIDLLLRNLEKINLNAEKTLFQRALGNLLSNAIRETPSGGNITVSARHDPIHVVISIEDSGVGIEPEHLPFVFDRFYRVDASRTPLAGGTGLGLAIVRSIATVHGGGVSISSKVGVGTRVDLFFPA